MTPLTIADVKIDQNCIGDRWIVDDIDQLSRLIGIIALGQVRYAAHILKELSLAAPAFTNDHLIDEAIIKLTVQDKQKKNQPRKGYPLYQRDGLIFEAISWIAARQKYGPSALLKDPHLSATSQGLDGLMIEIKSEGSLKVITTIFEDKCSENPKETFNYNVIPAFIDRHKNKRSAELIATAASLISSSGIDDATATLVSQTVLELENRRYRAALAVTEEFDSESGRKEIFSRYEVLEKIEQHQRVGASFVIDGELRAWFADLASRSVTYLKSFKEEEAHV